MARSLDIRINEIDMEIAYFADKLIRIREKMEALFAKKARLLEIPKQEVS